MTELAKHAPQSVTLASDTEVRPAPTVLEIIAAVARDPHTDVAKLEQLLALQERIQVKDAEIAFNQAFARMQPQLPRIQKNGKIDLGRGKPMSFARYEDIDYAIRPVLTREGFTLSFTSEPTDKGVLMTAVLAHALGHSRSSKMALPPDAGPGRNALQAIGSSHSYGKRYLTAGILNLIMGDDDDGNAAGWITEQQADSLLTLIQQCATPRMVAEEVQGKFLEHMGAKTLGEIHARDYRKAVTVLEERLRLLKEKAAQRAQVQTVDKLPDPIEPTLGTKMRCNGKLHEVYADAEGIQRWRETK